MTMTVAQIDAQIATLEAVKLKRLSGEQRSRVGYTGGMVEFAETTVEEINLELLRLKSLKQQLTGVSQGVGPLRVGFGGRP